MATTLTPDRAGASSGADLRQTRYGERPSSRRGLWWAIGIVVAATLAAVVWIAGGMLQPGAHGEAVSYRVVDETTVTAVIEVTRPVGSTTVCTIEALSPGFAQAGLVEIEVAPTSTAVAQLSVEFLTSEPANVVLVRGCEIR